MHKEFRIQNCHKLITRIIAKYVGVQVYRLYRVYQRKITHSENESLRILYGNLTIKYIPSSDYSEYSEFYPHLIWIPKSRDTVISKREVKNRVVQLIAFSQHYSNEWTSAFIHASTQHSSNEWTSAFIHASTQHSSNEWTSASTQCIHSCIYTV